MANRKRTSPSADEEDHRSLRRRAPTTAQQQRWSDLDPRIQAALERFDDDPRYKPVADALQEVLAFRGLRLTLKAGNTNRLLRMKSPQVVWPGIHLVFSGLTYRQELTHYLSHIVRVWSYIMGPRGACDLDRRSVELLQGRSPVCCAGDYRYICDQIDTGAVFPCIRDPAAREGVWRRALSIPTTIPSLQTFTKDSKYLLPCALAMRQLMPDAADETVQTSLSTYYEPDQGASAGCPEFFDAYRALWLYTMRHFPDLTGELLLLDGRGRGRQVFPSPETLARRRVELAYLARSLGFNSPQIRSLMEKGSSPVESLSYHPRGKPALTHRKGRWKLRDCCGMPSESSYLQSRPFMTLNNID